MSRRRWLFVVGVLVAFAAGALVASRTDPFPPGVEDPGARPTTTPTSEPPAPARWAFTLTSATRHDLHVGGSCSTRWRLRTTLLEGDEETFAGEGDARSDGAVCTTPTAQIQADVITLLISGSGTGDTVRVVVRETGREPVGARDLGGFANTLSEMVFEFRGLDDRGRARDQVQISDGNLGTYVSQSVATLRCVRGCDAA